MAQPPASQAAIDRIMRGASEHRLALAMCCCHPTVPSRRLLIVQVLCEGEGRSCGTCLRDGSVVERVNSRAKRITSPPNAFVHDEPRMEILHISVFTPSPAETILFTRLADAGVKRRLSGG